MLLVTPVRRTGTVPGAKNYKIKYRRLVIDVAVSIIRFHPVAVLFTQSFDLQMNMTGSQKPWNTIYLIKQVMKEKVGTRYND